ALRVGVGHEAVVGVRHHLPGDAPAVLEPAALRVLAAALDEALPEVVDLGLRHAPHLEREGLAELEVVAAVVGVEPLAAHLEGDAGEPGTREHLAVREHGRVELGRLAATLLVHEERPSLDLRHAGTPSPPLARLLERATGDR